MKTKEQLERRKAYMKAYNKTYKQTPERKAQQKAYDKIRYQKPEIKSARIQYRETPEYKAKHKAREQTPEYKDYMKTKRQTLECKAYEKARRLRRYNLTIEEYNEIFESQNGCCMGCGRHQTELSKALAVDHDHITGQVRGLLCGNCNNALGFVKDDPETLQRLLEYLK